MDPSSRLQGLASRIEAALQGQPSDAAVVTMLEEVLGELRAVQQQLAHEMPVGSRKEAIVCWMGLLAKLLLSLLGG